MLANKLKCTGVGLRTACGDWRDKSRVRILVLCSLAAVGSPLVWLVVLLGMQVVGNSNWTIVSPEAWRASIDDNLEQPRSQQVRSGIGYKDEKQIGSTWRRTESGRTTAIHDVSLRRTEIGWPIGALERTDVSVAVTLWPDEPEPIIKRNQIEGNGYWIDIGRAKVCLPLDPIWRGIFVNVLMSAGVGVLAVCVVLHIRSLRRRSCSQCLGCGYDVTGLELCSECGRPV